MEKKRISDSEVPELIEGLRKRGSAKIVTVVVPTTKPGFTEFRCFRAEEIADLIHRLMGGEEDEE